MKKFLAWHQQPLPDDYLSWDIETTGVNPKWDLPIDIGWSLVRDRKMIDNRGFILDWTRYPDFVEPDWLEEQLERIGYNIRLKGGEWVYTPDYLRKHGSEPFWVLRRFQQLLYVNRDAGAKFVGHNAWNFDVRMIEAVFAELLGAEGEPFVFDPDEIYDTGGMEKGRLGDMIPYPDEKTLKEFFSRIQYSRRKGLHWNLSLCAERYHLYERAGLTPEDMHGAKADAYVAHLLFEEHRKWLEESMSASTPGSTEP